MKKIIMFLCLCVFLTTPAMAEPTCEGHGGKLITAHAASDEGCDSKTCNGKTFCKSEKAMNWWSAFTWCESQGRKLADFSVMCPGVSQTPANTAGDCPNLQGLAESGWVWSSLASGSNGAFLVSLFSGTVRGGTRTDPSHYYSAFCE